MNSYTKTILLAFTFFVAKESTYGQKPPARAVKKFIFSSIAGEFSKPDSMLLPANASSIKFISGDTSFFKLSSANRKVIIVFEPSAGFIGIAKAQLVQTNSLGKSTAIIELTGLSTKGLEGENEPPLAVITAALGYQIDIGWTSLANNALPQLQGEELSSALFHKAGKGKVELIPVARYSPDFELAFGYYVDSFAMPGRHQVGMLSKAGTFPEHQCLFPAVAIGTTSFDPGQRPFGFYATSATHTAYSEDVWNMLYHPANAVRAVRIYPIKDKTGKIISNSYLLCFEEAKNGDYNDYVFVAKNIAPVTGDPFIKLLNGKNLDGWSTFLKDIGKNRDPNKNFILEDTVLHVVGEDLGYAITTKAFSNYHLKVDFKWGERRWGSRKNEKRDAGICYNISMNEPDSIWPQSIECQIQEGDVGDFWLLGFSTIKVNGQQNLPANHTRMIKQKDAERPYGEWNTVEVISYNGKCVQIVNGVVVNVGEEASIKNGRILLQSEYAEIYYRNVKIRQL
jgi:hypothetical protein